MYSNCCGASEWMEGSERCGQCKEHCVFEDHEETDEEIAKFNKAIEDWKRKNRCEGCTCHSQSNCKNK